MFIENVNYRHNWFFFSKRLIKLTQNSTQGFIFYCYKKLTSSPENETKKMSSRSKSLLRNEDDFLSWIVYVHKQERQMRPEACVWSMIFISSHWTKRFDNFFLSQCSYDIIFTHTSRLILKLVSSLGPAKHQEGDGWVQWMFLFVASPKPFWLILEIKIFLLFFSSIYTLAPMMI